MTENPGVTGTRAERQATQAWAFDRIAEHYDEAFPHKEGQVAAGEWLLERLAPGSRVLDVADPDSPLGDFSGIVAFFSLLMLPRAEIPAVLRKIHDLRHLSYAPASTEVPPEMQLFVFCRAGRR